MRLGTMTTVRGKYISELNGQISSHVRLAKGQSFPLNQSMRVTLNRDNLEDTICVFFEQSNVQRF